MHKAQLKSAKKEKEKRLKNGTQIGKRKQLTQLLSLPSQHKPLVLANSSMSVTYIYMIANQYNPIVLILFIAFFILSVYLNAMAILLHTRSREHEKTTT